jgi:PAS domain S-box-containing protein
MKPLDHEEEKVLSSALQNVNSILAARQKAERELVAAKESLKDSNDRIAAILDSITDGVMFLDRNWRFTHFNPRASQIISRLSKPYDQMIGKSIWDEIPNLVGTNVEQNLRMALDQQIAVNFETYFPQLNSWFDVRAFPAREGMTVYFQDVTSKKQSERIFHAERKVLGMIAAGESLGKVLDCITLETEAMSVNGLLCSILMLDDSGDHLVTMSAPSLPAPYNKGIARFKIGPNVGSCGTAAYERRPVFVTDIATDPLWVDYRDLALTHGLASCCSTPISSSQGELLGTIGMYYRNVQSPSEHDLMLVDLARNLAGIAMEGSKREEKLRTNEIRLRAIFNQAAVGIAIADLTGKFLEFNDKFSEILGYPATDLRDKSFNDVTYFEDLEVTQKNVDRLMVGEISNFAYEKRFVRKDGALVWCLTTVTLLKNVNGQPERFIGVIEDVSLRRAAEDERARLINILERSLNEIYIFDTKTLRFQYVNQGALRNLGYSSEAIREMTPLDIKPTFTAKQFQKIIDPLLSGVKSKEVFQTIHRRQNGTDYPVEVHLQCVTHSNQRVFLAVILDITERLKAEAALRQSEEELRALANSIPQLAWMAEPDGNIFWYNHGWYDYTGTTFEQMQGWGWQKVHDPDVLPAVLERWNESLKTGSLFEMEFPMRAADGSFRWFLTRVNPVRDATGKVVRWFGTNTDVDEVRRTQDALREESRVLELLNQTGMSIAFRLELQELAQTVTEAATQLIEAAYGAFYLYASDLETNATLPFSCVGASQQAFENSCFRRGSALFESTFQGGKSIRSSDITNDLEYRQFTDGLSDGDQELSIRSYLAVAVVSRSGDTIGGLFFGHPDANVFTARDERIIAGVAAQAAVAIDNARLYQAVKRAAAERENLLQAERFARTEAERVSLMKDEFLATLSHELRTPLNAILGWSQLLATGKVEGEDLIQGLETIQRNARAQAQLIEDLLDMSRIISGKIRLEIQRFPLNEIVDAAIAAVHPSANSKGITITKIVENNVDTISGDPHRLQQVIWNLLSNAVKFTPNDGRVDVIVRRKNSDVEIVVKDTGVGIPQDFLPHVFERFRQADASTTRKYGGLGLGLSIVKQLIELHGGSIQVSSDGVGQGSTFHVLLPTSLSSPDSRPGISLPVSGPTAFVAEISLKGLVILVVDDEPDSLWLVKRLLTECHATVLTANSADAGHQVLSSDKPDLLISDIGMPEKDGYQFIREVRSRPSDKGGQIPAIALTAFARSEDRTRAMLAGYQVHLAKPIEPQELVLTVASLAGMMRTNKPI